MLVCHCGDNGPCQANGTEWPRDVSRLDVEAARVTVGILVSVRTNLAVAQNVLQDTASAGTANPVGIALDSASGRLSIDRDSEGAAGSVNPLVDVTVITSEPLGLL